MSKTENNIKLNKFLLPCLIQITVVFLPFIFPDPFKSLLVHLSISLCLVRN